MGVEIGLIGEIFLECRGCGLSYGESLAMARAIWADLGHEGTGEAPCSDQPLSSWEDFTRRADWLSQGHFPHLAAWVTKVGGREDVWPDMFKDKPHDRRRKARKGMRTKLQGLLDENQELVWAKWYPTELCNCDIVNDLDALKAAHKLAQQRAKLVGAPAIWKIEEGRLGRVHVEFVSTRAACVGLSAVKLVVDVNLAHYLSKPMLGGGCDFDLRRRSNYPGVTAELLLLEKCAAVERWLSRASPQLRRQYWGWV